MKITVGELVKLLSVWPDDMEITFGESPGLPVGTPLEFFRLNERDVNLLQVELEWPTES